MRLAVCQHGANDTQESIEEEAHSTHDMLLECKCCKNAEMLRIMSRSQVGRKNEKDTRKITAPSKKATNTAGRGRKGNEATRNYRIGQFSTRLVECTKIYIQQLLRREHVK